MTSIQSLAIAAAIVCLAGVALAQPAGGGPPPEAIAACQGKASGATCGFTGRRGENLTGVCFTPPPRPAGAAAPQGAAQSSAKSTMPMACRPANAPEGPKGGEGPPKK